MAPQPVVSDALAHLARRVLVRLKVWAGHAARFGSAGSMVLAALLGAAACAFALAAPPESAPITVAPSAPGTAPDIRGHFTEISASGTLAPQSAAPDTLAPIGAPPPAAIETALDYDVVFFWPARPQTVVEPVAIRQGPASYARVIRSARPGERLRINGRVEDAPNGPWLRVRLADGQDGYFAARTVDVGAFRQRRAEEAAQVAATEGAGEALGAPLSDEPAANYGDPEIGPPSF